ncbi:MAG: glycosyltransferase family 4 protein [Candidatus Xenobiia bacterium LiM19]
MKSMPPSEKKPHILILSQYYAPDVTAAAFRIRETADLLAERGYNITVITAVPHRGDAGGKTGNHEERKARSAAASGSGTASCNGAVTVLRVPIIPYTGKGKLNYIVHYTSFMFYSILAAFKMRSCPDLVYATSPPLFAALAGWLIAVLKSVPFTLDVRDLWPESAVSAGQISRESIFFRVGKLMERHLYKAAKFITCVSKPMASAINGVAPSASVTVIYNGILKAYCGRNSDDNDSGRTGSEQKRGDVKEIPEIAGGGIPETTGSGVSANGVSANGVSANGVSASAVPEDREKSRTGNCPVTVLYTGNFGRCQAMDLYLEAARMLKESGEKDIEIRFVGDGVMRGRMESFVADNRLDNVIITGPVTKDEAFSEMGKSSALLLALIDDETMEKTIPSKVFDYMSAGKPVVYGIKGEGREILGAVGGNLVFDPSSPQSLADVLKALKARLDDLSLKARENAVQVKSRFTREHMVDRLDECFRKLLCG